MSLASCSTSSGLMPADPKNVTGSSLVSRPWCDMVSMRTVAPDAMRSAGAARVEKYPHTTVSGREPKVTSGLLAAGAGCAAADATRAAMPIAVQQINDKPRTWIDIAPTLPGKLIAQHSTDARPCADRARNPERPPQ